MGHGSINASCVMAIMMLSAMVSCSGEDRSEERPLAPVVQTLEAVANGDTCIMRGLVTESHNSTLRECGFVYGKEDEKGTKIVADSAISSFYVVVDSLSGGEYYCAAYARNGVDTSYGDTLLFRIRQDTVQ